MMTIPKSNPKPPKTGPKNPRGRKKSVKQNNLITSDQSLTQTQSRRRSLRLQTIY